MIDDLVGIAERVEEFYNNLFKKEPIYEEQIDETLQILNNKINNESKLMCDADIGEGEIETAILNLSRNKSPVIDGLIGEFYIEFKDDVIPILELSKII